MTDWSEYTRYYLDRIQGPEGESAYYSLAEADHAIVPILITAFRAEQDPQIRALLVDIIWQHRLPETRGAGGFPLSRK